MAHHMMATWAFTFIVAFIAIVCFAEAHCIKTGYNMRGLEEPVTTPDPAKRQKRPTVLRIERQ